MLWDNSLRQPWDSVVIKTHFIRLTADQPSKTGWMWNTEAASSPDWTALFRFRVSGQSQSLSGDGLAFWFISGEKFRPGMLLGHSDTFKGVGIMFDSFANNEFHSDVLVIASDGEDAVTLSTAHGFPGCSAKFRYWEGRPDFDVEQESVARISLQGTRMTVEVDANNKGKFEKCVDADLAKWLPKGKAADKWKANAHFAVSAMTGALSDNHDVLEIIVTKPEVFKEILQHEAINAETPNTQIDLHPDAALDARVVGEHVNSLAFEVKDVDDRLNKLHHQVEHEIEKSSKGLEKLIDKVAEAELKIETRVTELERRLTTSMMQSLEHRIRDLEDKLSKRTDDRHRQMESKLDEGVKGAASHGTSWRVPFMLFCIVACAAFVYLGASVRTLKKRDKGF